MAGTIPFGCGQCLPCRVNKRRQWQWRQYLESLLYDDNSFVTLTYADDKLPVAGSLEPQVVSLWIKRLRTAISPLRFRYLLVGEYGERTLRPHYHLSVFGLSGHSVCGRKLFSDWIDESWGRGFVQVAEFNELTAQYVAGYVVKKWTNKGHPALEGRHPEFARMSNRPGIGAGAMEIMARTLGSQYLSWETGDVPSELKIGGKRVPLGRYLLARLRKEMGFSDDYVKAIRDGKSYEKSIEMLALLSASKEVETVRSAYARDVEARVASLEARAKIYSKRQVL